MALSDFALTLSFTSTLLASDITVVFTNGLAMFVSERIFHPAAFFISY